MLIWGALLLLGGLGLLTAQSWARWFTIVVVSLNFLIQLGFLGNSNYPLDPHRTGAERDRPLRPHRTLGRKQVRPQRRSLTTFPNQGRRAKSGATAPAQVSGRRRSVLAVRQSPPVAWAASAANEPLCCNVERHPPTLDVDRTSRTPRAAALPFRAESAAPRYRARWLSFTARLRLVPLERRRGDQDRAGPAPARVRAPLLALRALGGVARLDAVRAAAFLGCSSESRRLSIAPTRRSSGSIARSFFATSWSRSLTPSLVSTTMRRGRPTSRRRASSPLSASREMTSWSWVLLFLAMLKR